MASAERSNEDITRRIKTGEDAVKRILRRNIDQIITEADFWKKIRSGRQLRIKHGVDPTNPFLHLGHAVNYWKMREFQELGHKVIFLIGDFTARIGDPTGRIKTRPELTEDAAEANAKKYLEQATKILINKPELLEVRRNSEWYDKMKLNDFLGLAKKITHSRLIERDMFQKRIKGGEEIRIHELLYPMLQAYDSVMIKSDLTIIGSDQLFNELVGRHYQEMFGQEPQVIITTVITPGLDGKEKMSKSLGNHIAILDSARDQFGKVMTIPDNLIHSYLLVYTKLSEDEIERIEKEPPFEAKKKLAFEIVSLYYGSVVAKKELSYFENAFSKKETPRDVEIYKTKAGENWGDFILRNKFVKSRSQAKQLVDAGGVDLDGQKITNAKTKVLPGAAKIGKFKFIKIE